VAAHPSAEDKQSHAKTRDELEQEKTFSLTDHSAADGMVTVWERDVKDFEEDDPEGGHYVPSLPV
jgi:hypothetical protein